MTPFTLRGILKSMNESLKNLSTWLGKGSINVFGPPFAGKDTQGRELARLLNGALIAGGDVLRSYHDQGEIDRIMARGDLLPSDLYLKIMLSYLSKPEFKNEPLILSAMGRLKGEESIVMKATTEGGHPIKAVVFLRLTEEEIWKRFEAAKALHDRGDRGDDRREALENRLIKFRTQTLPVIEFYRERGLLVEVDGSLAREKVTDEIIKALGTFASK